jgi:HemY protein
MRLVTTLLVVFAILALGAFLAASPVHVILRSAGAEYETSLAFAVGVIALAVVAVLGLVSLVSMVLGTPRRMRFARAERRRERGFRAITRGMVAIASGDTSEAQRRAREAQTLLPEKPLALLVAAQAAQLAGDEKAAEACFTAMLADKDIEFLGLRGLFIQATRRGDHGMALSYLKRASEIRPGTPWVSNALFNLHAERGRWDEAAVALARAERARVVDHALARRRRAVLLAAEANDVLPRDKARALVLAEEAVRLSPGLVPPAVIAARLLGEQQKTWKALGIVEAAWAQSPHPDLVTVYSELKPDETPRARASRLMGLAERNPDHIESRLLTAAQWTLLKDWNQARAALGVLPERLPSARVAALMAEIEQGRGDFQAQRYWLQRSVGAPREPQWICDNCRATQPAWSPLCTACNAFDSLSWRTSTEIKLVALPPQARAAQAGQPARRASAEGSAFAPLRARFKGLRSWLEHLRFWRADVEELSGPPQAPKPVEKGPVEQPIIFVSPRPPDDPGPGQSALEESRDPARW